MPIALEHRLELGRKLPGTSRYFDAYEASDVALQRSVFVKIARATADPTAQQIVFAHVRHWRALARETIAGMPLILGIGQHDGAWFIATQWIAAPSLRDWAYGPAAAEAEPNLIDTILARCLAILAPLHAAGFTHGDISPGNILCDWNEPRSPWLVDPAPPLDLPDPNDPTRRLILANPSFAAPEIAAGGAMTPRADLYSLGRVALELGRRLNRQAPDLAHRLAAPRPQDRPASAEAALELLHPSPPARAVPPGYAPPSFAAPPARGDEATALVSVPSRAPEDFATATTVIASAPAHAPPPGNAPPAVGNWETASMAMSVAIPVSAIPGGTNADKAMPADFSVMAPGAIEPGRSFVVEVWVAPSGRRDEMLGEATRGGRMVERTNRSHLQLDRDAVITVILKLPDFEVPDPMEMLGWNGDIRNVGFIVKAPAGLKPGLYPGVVKLMLGQVPFASIMFDLSVATSATEVPAHPLEARVQRIARVFASYASHDRAEVLRRVQGIRAAGTTVFLDIMALRNGEMWESTLYREIDDSDRLFLFWSRAAAASPWVEREWRYALERRGLDFIEPLPLEDPRFVTPPPELSAKHFNDMVLAFIAAEDVMRGGKDAPSAKA